MIHRAGSAPVRPRGVGRIVGVEIGRGRVEHRPRPSSVTPRVPGPEHGQDRQRGEPTVHPATGGARTDPVLPTEAGSDAGHPGTGPPALEVEPVLEEIVSAVQPERADTPEPRSVEGHPRHVLGPPTALGRVQLALVLDVVGGSPGLELGDDPVEHARTGADEEIPARDGRRVASDLRLRTHAPVVEREARVVPGMQLVAYPRPGAAPGLSGRRATRVLSFQAHAETPAERVRRGEHTSEEVVVQVPGTGLDQRVRPCVPVVQRPEIDPDLPSGPAESDASDPDESHPLEIHDAPGHGKQLEAVTEQPDTARAEAERRECGGRPVVPGEERHHAGHLIEQLDQGIRAGSEDPLLLPDPDPRGPTGGQSVGEVGGIVERGEGIGRRAVRDRGGADRVGSGRRHRVLDRILGRQRGRGPRGREDEKERPSPLLHPLRLRTHSTSSRVGKPYPPLRW